MTSEEPIVDIRDLAFHYGGVWAVNGASFTIDRGAVTGLIGPNGAGKSTLIELLSGTLTPHRGSILYQGVDTAGFGPPRVAQMGIARTFQTARVLPRLPVIENVMVAAGNQVGESPLKAIFWRSSWRKQEAALREEATELLDWLGLRDHLLAPAGTLSGGQRRLMEIARALMAHPKLLLLDEPTAGVFPETSRLIATRVREIAKQGVGILLIAHNMGFLSTVADDVVVMAEGRVLTRGPLEVVRTHQEVIAAYLGASNARPELGEQVGSA
ncbi:MAG TPA: ABC transporter ATP-binding protein [Candidatus Dormibacteraeota bacterium]|jgi:ABC-type branched-subunit amino acid transport system ATPase component|nr:ABC transporter ATP-binding protein [Candidatus Dormibacteraeota bacterium]